MSPPLVNTIFHKYSDDVGKLLIHTGALGWLLSSIAQVYIVATDKNIDKKEKKFLVPQEICDGATNVFLFYTVSNAIKKGADRLVDSGYIMTDEVANALEPLMKQSDIPANGVKGLSCKLQRAIDKASDLSSSQKSDLLNKIRKNPLEAIKDCLNLNANLNLLKIEGSPEAVKKELETALKNQNKFKGGIGVIAAIGAGILAANIITPIVRNKLGGVYQQQFMKQKDVQEAEKPQIRKPVNMLPVSPVFNVFTNSGNLRI